MNKYIRIYDHALTAEFCSELIHHFDQHPRFWEEEGRLTALSLRDQAVWDRTSALLRAAVTERVNQLALDYARDCDCIRWWPRDYSMETARIKRYDPQQGQCFPPHVDVDRRANSGRFLSFLFYLNDSDAGTRFVDLDLTVAAVRGRCLVFPPQWQWPHEGLLPQQGRKYIVSSYLHYV